MARIARLTVPGVLHHVISRFVDREWFFESDRERGRYLRLLGKALAKSDWRCLAYCLMSNHIHLAMVGGELDFEVWTKGVNSPFALWLNDERGRLGPVFADRPAAYLVPRHREAEVIAYIHNNPVRAALAENARDSSWSSHRAYVGLAHGPKWLCVEEGLQRAGCAGDRDQFEMLVNGAADTVLELPDLERARAAVRKRGPFEIGTPTLSDPPEVPVVRRTIVGPRPTATTVLAATADVVGIQATAASRRHAHGATSLAKRVFIHAAVQLGITIADASAIVNVSRQRGAKVAHTPLPTQERAVMMAVVALVSQGARR